jgi:hypothetical protein
MLEFNIFADYFQFYIQDEAADGNLSDAWSDEAVDQLFAVGPGVVGIGTVRNMDVPVTVEILDAEKAVDLAEWDHVIKTASKATIATTCSYGRRPPSNRWFSSSARPDPFTGPSSPPRPAACGTPWSSGPRSPSRRCRLPR